MRTRSIKDISPAEARFISGVIKARGEANTRDKLERRMRMLDHQLFNDTGFTLYWWRGMDSWRRTYNNIRLTSERMTTAIWLRARLKGE